MPAKKPATNGSGDTQSPKPIRRGQGLRLSVEAAPAEPAAVAPPEDAPAPSKTPRRGQGLRLSTHTPHDETAAPNGASAASENGLPPAHKLRLAHGDVSYRQAGKGIPLLLIHGWGASSRYWIGTLGRLSDARSCYALDLPGFGESPPLAAPVNVPRLAALVIEAADALGLEQFDLNGHSFGGAVAAYVAARWPDRVRKLAVTTFGVRRSSLERALLTLALAPIDLTLPLWQPVLNFWQPCLNLMQPLITTAMSVPPIPQALSAWYMDSAPADPRLLREGLTDLTRMGVGAHLACVASVGDPVVVDALADIAAPTLFVAGARDRVMPPDDVRAAAEMVGGSQVTVLDRCGHVPMIERPGAYHAALRDFLVAE